MSFQSHVGIRPIATREDTPATGIKVSPPAGGSREIPARVFKGGERNTSSRSDSIFNPRRGFLRDYRGGFRLGCVLSILIQVFCPTQLRTRSSQCHFNPGVGFLPLQ